MGHGKPRHLDPSPIHGDTQRERLLYRSILEETGDRVGEQFLRQLVRQLVQALDMPHAFVAEFAGSRDRVKTVAFWSDGDWLENVTYDLAGTPCSEVVRSGFCLCRDDVQKLYPEDLGLVTLGARSYLGIALGTRESGPVGHLALLDRKPILGESQNLSILQLFADRARIELERMRTEHLLQETLTELAVSSRDLGLAHDELEALLRMNQAVSHGLERDDLFGALAASLSALLAADRFGIELPFGTDQLRGHLLTPVDGALPSRTDAHVLPAEGTACDWVLRHAESLTAPSREELRERFPATFDVMLREGMESLCVIPLKSESECRAALFLMASSTHAYDEVRKGLLDQLGAAVSVALDNSLAHEELRDLKNRLAAENQYLQEEIRHEHDFSEIVGRSPAIQQTLAKVAKVAPSDTTVLILGESGTGKELIARAIHARSRHASNPLIKVNCAAIPEGLLESELFGHEKGAFTGATQRRIGRFELANDGTIFLDEIGELPLEAQVKLLRVLQEREFERVGGSTTYKVDVRVLAASNRDLPRAIDEGRFRGDLYYRLNVFPLELPPLRERIEDVPLLAQFFVDRLRTRAGRSAESIDPGARERLAAYSWPGNVRELENVIERALILSAPGDRTLGGAVIDAALPRPLPATRPVDASSSDSIRFDRRTLEELERHHIQATLHACGGRIEGDGGAAQELGLAPSTLRSLMKRLDIAR
jgi:formate hydrogenlyase transcriptional activator